MSLLTYTKGSCKAQVDVAKLADDQFQGTVLLLNDAQPGASAERHDVTVMSSSAEEAFEEAKALAHRLLDKSC